MDNAILSAAVLISIAVYFWLETAHSRQCLHSNSLHKTKKFIVAALFSWTYAEGLALLGQNTQVAIFGYHLPLFPLLFCHSALPLFLIEKRTYKITPYLVLLQIWLPVELRLLPGPSAFNMIAMAVLVLLVFKGVLQHQPLFKLHCLRRSDFAYALIGLALFSALAIPIGLYCGALRFRLANFDLFPMLQFLAIGYLCIALVEEIVFRACLQGMLQQQWKKPKWALVTASLIFGICHLQKNLMGTAAALPNLLNSPYFPNWIYATLAALAGIFYGAVWAITGKATASAMTHALVNFIRKAVFGNGSF